MPKAAAVPPVLNTLQMTAWLAWLADNFRLHGL